MTRGEKTEKERGKNPPSLSSAGWFSCPQKNFSEKGLVLKITAGWEKR